MSKQLEELKKAVSTDIVKLIVVKGLRRTGKTSLILVALKTIETPFIYVDCRTVEPLSYPMFQTILLSKISKLVKSSFKGKLQDVLKRIREVELAGVKISIERKQELITSALESLPSKTVLVLDEAQYLAPLAGVKKLLAYIYDHVENVKTIVSGSEIGVLSDFIGENNPKSPLYGRPWIEVETSKLTRKQAETFLKQGFKQAKFKISQEEIEEASDKLNGVIGWLTFYGWNTVTLKSHKKGLKRTLREGSSITLSELSKFLETRGLAKPKYEEILKALALKPMKWSELKRQVENTLNIKIANNQFTHYLKELRKYSIIEKEDKFYKITDPILAYALRKRS